MTKAKQLILKGLVVTALGFAWLSMKPRVARADGCAEDQCLSYCPIDPDLWCYTYCGGLENGACGTKSGCVQIWIDCS